MNTARTARGNRLGLALTGLVLLIGGGYLITRSLGGFGSRQAQDPIYSTGTAGWIHDQRPWFWVVLTALAVILAALLIRWLLAQLRTDSLNRIALDTDTSTGRGAGRAGLPAAALTAAVGAEIDSYPGSARSGRHWPAHRISPSCGSGSPSTRTPTWPGSAAGSPVKPWLMLGPRWTPSICPPSCG